MADKFFKNFPEVSYTLNDGKQVFIKDFFRKSKIEQEAVNSIISYDVFELNDGDRPDIVADRLYGNSDLHWTFYLVNDFENYYDWHKDSRSFENYIKKKFPGQLALANNTTDIVDSGSNNKFLLGEKVTSVSSEGRIIEVSPIHKRICIEGGNFVANELITGAVSGKTFTPTSVKNHRDGVSYYKNSDGVKKNTEGTGFSVVTLYEDEEEKNEAKRRIKYIRPQLIETIVKRFEEVMSS